MRDFPVTASPSGDRHVPAACPACHSMSIVTTAKIPDSASYWRCRECGQVWNAARDVTHQQGASRWR